MEKRKLLIAAICLMGLFLIAMAPETEPWPVPEEYQKMANPYADYEDEDQIGRMVYSKYCTMCHGKKGKGDGAAGKMLEPPASDLTTTAQTEGSIYYKILTGRNGMPGFEKIIKDDEDFWMLVKYVKDLEQ